MPYFTTMKKKGLSQNISVWIGLISTALGVILSIWNSYRAVQIENIEQSMRLRMAEAEITSRKLMSDIEQKKVSLDYTKEKTARYELVQKQFDSISKEKDQTKKYLQ